MKRLSLSLLLFALAAVCGTPARAQAECPYVSEITLRGIDLQHAQLLHSPEARTRRIALQNVIALSRPCFGRISFEQVIPALFDLYEHGAGEESALARAALEAVADGQALRQLRGHAGNEVSAGQRSRTREELAAGPSAKRSHSE